MFGVVWYNGGTLNMKTLSAVYIFLKGSGFLLVSPTVYDLYDPRDRLAYIDPMRSGRESTINDQTAMNVAQLISVLVSDADHDSLNEIRRVVSVNYDMERTMDALFEELERNVSYNVAQVAVRAREQWNKLLTIGL